MGKDTSNNKSINNRKILERVLTIILVIFLVLCFGVCGVLIYQKRYLTSFWVNGQSMYPTLNKNITDMDGNEYGADGGGIHGEGAKNVDYGVMDCHKSAINRIKRFDIVVCNYSQNDSSDKIKRVIGLPGETMRFIASSDEHNGELQIKNRNGEYKVVNQPLDQSIIQSGYYSEIGNNIEYILGSDEYFVVGDNRALGKSNDSRSVGPIKKEFIVGKVVAIVASCEAYRVGNGYDIRNINYFSWPRFF